MKVRDCLWIWGQDAMSHQNAFGNNTWKLPSGNSMDSEAGANFLGIPNVCRVVMCGAPEPPFDAESEKLKNMKQVVWSVMGDSGSVRNDQHSDLEEVIRQAGLYANITGAVMDDFFNRPTFPCGRRSVEELKLIRQTLAKVNLPLWVVWYKRQLEWPLEDYLNIFDVITYWNMKAPDEHALLRDDLARMVERTPGKRRLTGCYIWNYGGGRPLTLEEIRFECECYFDLLKSGQTEGIIFCGNCCADLPAAATAVNWLRDWIKEIGNEDI